MNPIALIIMIILVSVILASSRKWAALAFVSGVIYLTQGNGIIIGGFNLLPIRFIEVAGFLRVIIRKELSISDLKSIDKYFLLFNIVYLLTYLIRLNIEPGLTDSYWYRVGFFVDAFLSYFSFRGLLNEPLVFKEFLKSLSFLIVPFALLMIIEAVTGRNLFSIMGGVPETPILRDSHYRCQGSFRVAITAGSFGATLIPLFIYLTFSFKERIKGIIGILACLAIVIASHSSGPLMGFAGGIIAWLCWRWREKMRTLRWMIAGSLISLHLVMKAPVWFLFDRISGVIGGDGWHRANLIDKFVNNFKDWWLMGMPLEKTADWAATTMPWGVTDITNEYVSVGINGGLISFVLFIFLLTKCYQALGYGMRKYRSEVENSNIEEPLLWSLGCALFSHILNITSVTYWDQIYVIWYMTLAAVSSMTVYYLGEQSDFIGESEQTLLTPAPQVSKDFSK
jgi:hypothetical protein